MCWTSGCNLSALGATGELYIGGGGVAAGYLNQPELTRERFVPDPFSKPGDRLYRTGDRVRMRTDGNLEFLGRLDGQVKVAGHRIEPEEVEAALLRHTAVRQAAVTARGISSVEKHLVAYVVAADPSTFCSEDVKCALAKSLPRHLVPTRFVVLDKLPLTANGKVDRAALPAPVSQAQVTSESNVPGLESEVAKSWTRVLGRAVGPDENFFDLGGTSLQLLEMHAILTRQIGREIPLMLLFEYPTVRSLARHLVGTGNFAQMAAETQDRARLQREAMARQRKRS